MADIIRMMADFLPAVILLLVGLFIYLTLGWKRKKSSLVETQFLSPQIPPYCIRCAAPLDLDVDFDFDNIVPHANDADIAWFVSSKFSSQADTTLQPQLDNTILPNIVVAKFHICGEKVFQFNQCRREDFLEFFFLHEKCYQAEEELKATRGRKADRATNISGCVMGILLTLVWLAYLVKWFVLDQLSAQSLLLAVCLLPFFIVGVVAGVLLLVSKKAKFDPDFVLVKGWFRKDNPQKNRSLFGAGTTAILDDKLTYQFSNSDFAIRFRELNTGILLLG